MTQRPRQQTRPLDGLRVLDLSRAVSGPLAGRILADLGADVVRAELPGTDVTQAFGKVTRGRSGLYSHVNAGKRSIVLDLHQPGDVARLLDLAAACDVVVENFRPGVLDRFGAGWPALSAVNPRLVMLSISGFGREGDDAERAAYAPVIHAEAGLIGRQADITGDPPADIAFALADALAGLHGTIAILAALRLRDRTGTGQHIDLSMLEAMLATDDYTHYSIDEHPVRPARGEVWPAPGGPILISADRRYLWRQLKTCFGVADPDPDAPLEDKLRARARVMADVVHRPPGPRRAQARPGNRPAGLGGHQARRGCPGRAVGGRARHRSSRSPTATGRSGRWCGCPTGSATPPPGPSAASPNPASTPTPSSATGPAARTYPAPADARSDAMKPRIQCVRTLNAGFIAPESLTPSRRTHRVGALQ